MRILSKSYVSYPYKLTKNHEFRIAKNCYWIWCEITKITLTTFLLLFLVNFGRFYHIENSVEFGGASTNTPKYRRIPFIYKGVAWVEAADHGRKTRCGSWFAYARRNQMRAVATVGATSHPNVSAHPTLKCVPHFSVCLVITLWPSWSYNWFSKWWVVCEWRSVRATATRSSNHWGTHSAA